LNFKVNLTNSTVLQRHSQLHVVPDPLAIIRNLGDWNPVMNYGFSPTGTSGVYNVSVPNDNADQGVVTISLGSNHNSLTNPLIVVEGFDPGYYLTPESLTGFTTYGDWISSIPSQTTLYSLLTSQYDIVWIDFTDGSADIRNNAVVVEDVIRWVNANKTSSNPNVVLGLSMGGLCARYALKKMENGGETHQVGLFISHGVPEQGVSVPLSLQYLETHLNSLYLRAGPARGFYQMYSMFWNPTLPNLDGVLTLSDLPSAEEMLINHLNASYQIDNSVHNAWETELNALGYPSQGGIRNIAVSNGSECGQTQTLPQNGQILYLNGKLNTSLWAI
jgi:hypothetical protein